VTPKHIGIRFGFPTPILPDGVEAGTNILVKGDSDSGAREVALRLTEAETYRNDGQLLLSADVNGRRLLDTAATMTDTLDPSRIAVIDCSGIADKEHRFDQLTAPIGGPGDLMDIEIEFATLYEKLRASGYDRVRIGVFSVSSLLAHSDLPTVSRFIHMLTGRIIATGDLGVFHIDSTLDADVTIEIIEHFCDLTVEVRRRADGEVELRSCGHAAEDSDWHLLDSQPANRQRRRS
jgi:KaiC/GvpD/RAD55 family RecA-like ATPase